VKNKERFTRGSEEGRHKATSPGGGGSKERNLQPEQSGSAGRRLHGGLRRRAACQLQHGGAGQGGGPGTVFDWGGLV
jgi:hypothetical protein